MYTIMVTVAQKVESVVQQWKGCWVSPWLLQSHVRCVLGQYLLPQFAPTAHFISSVYLVNGYGSIERG